jgi:hypothetical protein
MKVRDTQRLFWKQWPFKAIIEIKPNIRDSSWRRMDVGERKLRFEEFERVSRWCKARYPDAGMRKETHLSLFLTTEAELDDLISSWGGAILEIWKPANDVAKDLLTEHSYDVVRAKPWYGKFPIRARILYDNDFKVTHLPTFKEAVASIDTNDWHAAGLLEKLINQKVPPAVYGWGQPLHLYLASTEDAALLRLTCGSIINRFERIRKPS